ncbi:MAG: putative toxin-antitoxin system toxin component, PIN family [Candidatus Veblenbacteria bacterium]|nr:putative toxin-antitoxin system toxin component, PIN family [Candidatus Veblenbacteria bacterium]
MVRVVLDTNVLVNADRGEFSHPKRILDLVRWGEVEAVISNPVRREKQLIFDRLVQDDVLRRSVREYFAKARLVTPVPVEVEIEDAEDVKLLELAVGGQAQFLITDDRHLLEVGECQGVKILTPKEFWQWWEARQDQQGAGWQSWAKAILGK